MAKRNKKLRDADEFRAQVISLLNEPRTDWSDWEQDWLSSEARRRDEYLYTDRERTILNRLIMRARVFTHYSEVAVQELAKIAYAYRGDLDEDSEAFVEQVYMSKASRLRVRQINRLAGIARLSYALPYDNDIEEVMRLIWTEDDTELPPYVLYEMKVA